MKPHWSNETVTLGSLKPWERNPRYSTEDDATAIVESHELWGQSDVICIDLENNVLNGHQRLSAWLAKYGPGFEVDVRRADRVFDEAEKQAFTAFMHAKAVGRFDWQEIANWGWDADEYRSFGFDEDFAKTRHEEAFAVEAMLAEEKKPNELSADEKVINSEFMILIECDSEQEQNKLLERFISEGLECRALLS